RRIRPPCREKIKRGEALPGERPFGNVVLPGSESGAAADLPRLRRPVAEGHGQPILRDRPEGLPILTLAPRQAEPDPREPVLRVVVEFRLEPPELRVDVLGRGRAIDNEPVRTGNRRREIDES